MKCFKFVTKGLKSPGVHIIINYSNFGKEITAYADPASYGQCARGLHVIPYLKNKVDWKNVIVSDKIIILDVKPEDIVFQNDNGTGKMRVSKATPLRLANKKEISHIRQLACNNSYQFASQFAKLFDKCGKQNTRKAACKDPHHAYDYARLLDKNPTNETRKACCKSPYYAYNYAVCVDRKGHKDTRKTACKDSNYAMYYAQYVDKCGREDTRKAACKDYYYAYLYALHVDKSGRDDTRKAACREPYYAYLYALHVDKCKHPDTWKVVKGTEYGFDYKNTLGSY